MKTTELPDELITAINSLLKLHGLMGSDARTSAVGFVAIPRPQYLLDGRHPIELDEVLQRLEQLGAAASVKMLREKIAKLIDVSKKAANETLRLRASAARKLNAEERAACGLDDSKPADKKE